MDSLLTFKLSKFDVGSELDIWTYHRKSQRVSILLATALTQPNSRGERFKHKSNSDAWIPNANHGSETKLAVKLTQLWNIDTVLRLKTWSAAVKLTTSETTLLDEMGFQINAVKFERRHIAVMKLGFGQSDESKSNHSNERPEMGIKWNFNGWLVSKDANPKVRYCWGGAAAAKRPKAETNWNSNAKWKHWTHQDCPSTAVTGDNGWTSQNDQSPNLLTQTTCCIPSPTPEVVEFYALEGQSDCPLGNREYCTAVTRFNVPWR